jgi:hypothetical protein
MSALEHSIRAYKGYDYRDDPNDQRGAHGLDLTLIAKGPEGAITARVGTGWMLRPLAGRYVRSSGPQARHELPGVDAGLHGGYPTGGPVVSHVPTRLKDWWQSSGPCDVLGLDECFGDIGYLVGDDVLKALIEGGDEAAFAKLDEIYRAWILDEEPGADAATWSPSLADGGAA